MPETDHMNYVEFLGTKVAKSLSGKPFKSGLKENTVKGIILHPVLKVPAFTFEEDDSYVECRRCFQLDHEVNHDDNIGRSHI